MTDTQTHPRQMLYRDPANGHFRTSVDGCWAYHTCLACPLPRCVFDTTVTPSIVNRLRDQIQVEKLAAEGFAAPAIAATLTLSVRTVYRYLAPSLKAKARSPRAAAVHTS